MRRVIIAIVLLVFISGIASASIFIVEGKVGYFNPTGTELKGDFKTFFNVGGEVTFGILPGIKFWAGINYLTAKGQEPDAAGENLHLTPIGGGLKYIVSTGLLRFYGGVGVNYIQYKNTTPIEDITDKGIGYVLKLGALFNVKGPFVVDVFFENTYGKVNPLGNKIKVGGIVFGIGIGFESFI